MAEKIIITGGAGFIGSHLTDRLVSDGHSVVVLDDLSTGRRQQVRKSARLVVKDIRDDLRALFRRVKPDVVFHLAAQTDLARSLSNPQDDAQINVVGSLNVLEASVAAGVRKLVFASSCAVYGEQVEFPAPESHPTEPVAPYGANKLAVEKYLANYRDAYGLDTVALRFANAYGPRQRVFGEAGVVAVFFERFLSRKRVTIYGTGRQTRDFLYVGDAVEAFVRAMKRQSKTPVNIGTGVETTVNSLFAKINRLCDKPKKKPKRAPRKKGDQMRASLDPTLARKRLGWQPRVPLDEGLNKIHIANHS
jgi:UDP-glucose 4-epimerase